jgi:hypothetical protein
MLGKEPFSFLDKELYAFIHGNQLINNIENALSYTEYVKGGERELIAPQSIVTQVYNPITPFNILTEVVQGADTEVGEVSQADLFLGTEGLTRSYVIGPR